ncbi:MAG TPA: hypothetical protein VGB20_05575 [bacterium]
MRVAVALACAMMLIGAPAVMAASQVAQDTVVDKVGDWMATIGKSGTEKDAALAQRKAERTAARVAKAAEKQAKKAGKQMEQAGKDMKKGLGNLGQ